MNIIKLICKILGILSFITMIVFGILGIWKVSISTIPDFNINVMATSVILLILCLAIWALIDVNQRLIH